MMTNRELAKELCGLASNILEHERDLDDRVQVDPPKWLPDVYEIWNNGMLT